MHDDSDLDAGGGAEQDSPATPQPPHETVVEPADTIVEPGELDGDVEDTAFEASDELHEEFAVEALATALGPDGLPDHSNDPVGAGALPYTIESVTCIADERTFVEVFAEELVERGWRHVLDHKASADGGPGAHFWVPPAHCGLEVGAQLRLNVRTRYGTDGAPVEPRQFKPSEVAKRWGEWMTAGYTPVRPAREACRYYRRQHFGLEDQPDPKQEGHNMFMLMCTHPSRRSVAGAAMRLNNEAVYGCDFRDPPDPRGTEQMDRFYDAKLRERPDLVRLPLFGLPGDEVRTEDDGRAGGIFEGS
jgi:hypothetical protein